MSPPLFTVFTPTFNRASTLSRVYDSLCRQTLRDFEWLIVDDGSWDQTADLVKNWQANANFPIRYFWQPNGGKHRAFNKGVSEAHGELFLTLDSDDRCLPEALERFRIHWQAIPIEHRRKFSAVTALCVDAEGHVVGSRFPHPVFESDSLAVQHRYGFTGEKWGFQRVDVLRQFPFPEFDGETFIPEGVVWNRIAMDYRTLYVNEALRVYETSGDSLSRRSLHLRIANLQGTLLYYRELLAAPIPARARLRAAVNLVRFSLHGGRRFGTVLNGERGRIWLAAAFPLGVACYWRDVWHFKRQ